MGKTSVYLAEACLESLASYASVPSGCRRGLPKECCVSWTSVASQPSTRLPISCGWRRPRCGSPCATTAGRGLRLTPKLPKRTPRFCRPSGLGRPSGNCWREPGGTAVHPCATGATTGRGLAGAAREWACQWPLASSQPGPLNGRYPAGAAPRSVTSRRYPGGTSGPLTRVAVISGSPSDRTVRT